MFEQKQVSIGDAAYDKSAIIYFDQKKAPKACILYFHGGGLLYGHKADLPEGYIQTLTEAGYQIISFDYPLAPAARLPLILDDVRASIHHFLDHPELYGAEGLPYFLWGRSAGAYLCLIAAAYGYFKTTPAGILSYYGYGFLCDHWFQAPSSYYKTLPPVDASCLSHLPAGIETSGDLTTHYSIYVYARQTGKWLSLLYEGREKFFYLDYTLRTCDTLPCPLFATHATNDTDVPFDEFRELVSRYHPKTFIAACDVHDFDREADNPFTGKLLEATLSFLDSHS